MKPVENASEQITVQIILVKQIQKIQFIRVNHLYEGVISSLFGSTWWISNSLISQ